MTSALARTALSHRICTGVSRERLGALVAELALPWMAGRDSRLRERRGHDRLRAAGTFRQSTDLTKPQRDIFTALNVTPPKKIIDLNAGR